MPDKLSISVTLSHQRTFFAAANHMAVFEILTVFMLLICSSGFAKPPFPTWSVYASIKNNKCETTDGIDELCQKCAKFTKSDTVYPMCCSNQDEARMWCKKAMDFGQ